MSKLTIRIENHEQTYTVSEMRKRLAQVLSKLNGDQEVTFTFVANLEHYSPVRAYGEKYQENLMQTAAAMLVDDHSGINPPALAGDPNMVLGESARPENN